MDRLNYVNPEKFISGMRLHSTIRVLKRKCYSILTLVIHRANKRPLCVNLENILLTATKWAENWKDRSNMGCSGRGEYCE